MILGRHRQQTEVQASQKKIDQLLAELAARVPWALYGFSKEIEGAWQKDFAGFVAMVESRRHPASTKSPGV
jgi:hypothetical protein